MKRFTRIGLFVALPSLGIIGMAYAAPNLAENCGLDFWNYSKVEQELSEYRQIDSRLNTIREHLGWKHEFRSSLVDDLIEGHATIEQTVRRFRELNPIGFASPEMLRLLYQSEDDQYVAGRQLIAHLENRAEIDARCAKYILKVENWLRSEFPTIQWSSRWIAGGPG